MTRELIIDSFAGGGGASLGIELATGRSPDVAINHDADAIRMHAANHPQTKHFTEDVWKVSPTVVTRGRRVGLLWASPDCKHFSRAKGSKPVNKTIRSLAWVVCKWAAEARPRVIVLENVREFADWGPVVPRWRCSACQWSGTEGQLTLARINLRCPRCESRRVVITEDMVPCPDRKGRHMLPIFCSPGVERVVEAWPRHGNVWLGTSVENQATADERIPHLLRVPAAVRFLSMEPLLGPVDLDQWLHPCCERGEREGESPCPICIDHGRKYEPSGIHWIIAGGESGNDARPMQIEWVRSILQQCRSAGVPCFIKQLGDDPRERNPSAWPVEPPTGRWPNDPGRKPLKLIGDGFGNHLVRGLRSKGGDWNDWPADLRVREIPR